MPTEAVVCAHCGTEEDINVPTQPCARCNCELTKIENCTCHVFDYVETGTKVHIGYRYTTHNPQCKVHG